MLKSQTSPSDFAEINADSEQGSNQDLARRGLRSFRQLVPDWQKPEGDEAQGQVLSPLSQSNLPRPTETPLAQVDEAFAHARDAAHYWRRLGLGGRSAILRRFDSLLWKYQEQILDVIQWETAKPRQDAFSELLDASLNIGYLCGKGPRILKQQRTSGAIPLITKAMIHRRPVGVVGVISPWNYPFTLAFSDAAAALYAGNPVVLKPASQTPLSAMVVRELLERAGLPPHTYQLVFGPGGSHGQRVAEQADFVMFTGSTQVGRGVAELCGKRLVGCSAELGGKNPSVVFPDADLEQWSQVALRECFSSSGQLCVSIERIYIHDEVWDQAIEKLENAVRSLSIGRSFEWSVQFGPLVSAKQLQLVSAHVEDAREKGARVLIGGHAMPEVGETAYAPTLLTDVTPEMKVYAEETFGPVVSLYRWSDPQQLMEDLRAGGYGLHGSVWTEEAIVANDIAQAMHTGSVSICGDYMSSWGAIEAPIGGTGSSGIGRRHGTEGLLKYTEAQTVATTPRQGIGPWFGMDAEQWGVIQEAMVRARGAIWRLTRR